MRAWTLGFLVACSACHPAASPTRTDAPPPAASAAPSSEVAIVSHLTPAQIAAKSTAAIGVVSAPPMVGTGFVVDPSGVVVTNLHLVLSDQPMTVAFADKRVFPVVAVLGISEAHDLALLKIDGADLPTLALGDSDAVRSGDAVVAIGHAFGLEDAVGAGLVSGFRPIAPDLRVLDVSVAIADGSSGGPIFDESGDVIAVATAISGGSHRVSFGVPTRYLKELLAAPEPVSADDYAALVHRRFARRSLPKPPPRDIPQLETKSLAGCSADALKLTVTAIAQAVDVGAPLYNEGKIEACFHVYEGAALDLERKLPKTCKAATKVLEAGRKKAAGLSSPVDQAWAMRDAFDGLMDVIDRKRRDGM